MNLIRNKSTLIERISYDSANMMCESVLDDITNQKQLYMKGILIQGGTRNQNGRIYPINEIQKAVEEVNYLISQKKNPVGEADHPPELTINIDRISHVITDMWLDGQNGCGKLKILPTPHGNIIRTLLESNIRLGCSSRGSGNVDENGYVSDFQMVTVDIVVNPSAPEAFPVPVYESQNAKRSAIIQDLAESVIHDPKAQKHLKKELLNWITNLKG